MSVHQDRGVWRVKWREGDRQRSRTFESRAEAERFDGTVRHQQWEAGERVRTPQAPTHVYVVAGADKVKIGTVARMERRLAEMQLLSPVPLTVVRLIESESPRRLEHELHERYAEHRAHGEWFDAEPVLADLAQSFEQAR